MIRKMLGCLTPNAQCLSVSPSRSDVRVQIDYESQVGSVGPVLVLAEHQLTLRRSPEQGERTSIDHRLDQHQRLNRDVEEGIYLSLEIGLESFPDFEPVDARLAARAIWGIETERTGRTVAAGLVTRLRDLPAVLEDVEALVRPDPARVGGEGRAFLLLASGDLVVTAAATPGGSKSDQGRRGRERTAHGRRTRCHKR